WDDLLHVVLDLVDRLQLVRRLRVREGVLELALPWGVRAVGVALRRHPHAVEADELAGDLLDRLAGAALRLLPVRTAEPVEVGRLPADIPGEQVERVRRHEQAVAGLTSPRRGVLDDEIFALATVDRPADHLQIPADPVLLVHDEVTWLERQRVDRVAPAPRRHPLHVAGRLAALAGDVALAQHGELEPRRDEAAGEHAGGDGDEARFRHDRQRGDPAYRHLSRTQLLDRAHRRTVALEDHRDPPAVAGPLARVGGGSVRV